VADVTATLTIKDVARRTGFTAATLRYYETLGLIDPPDRTPAGYRLYDDRTIDQLGFVARAKQLGCSLDEIAALTAVWHGGECGPVQDQLRTLVADKLADTRRQIAELTVLASELAAAAESLDQHRPAGPCDDRCGCVVDGSTIDLPEPIAFGRRA